MEIGYVGEQAHDDEDVLCGQCREEGGERVEIYMDSEKLAISAEASGIG